ncbi:MAG: mucoidy inhibitor MuiA family protein [Burkholderiaceae bacterium]
MPPSLSSRPLALAALALAALVPAHAQSAAPRAEGASRISAVKLYPGSATVERVLRVAPGARQATFHCLPAALDTASLQVSAASGIRVGELAVRQQPRELLGAACASPLDERIRALQDQIAGLQAESSAIELATGYYKSFGQPGDGPRAGTTTPAQIAATAQALRQGGQAALARQHELARQQEQLERELKPLLAERERSTSAHARVSTVQVTLAAPQGGELRLSYAVRGPGWQPSYRATLDSASKKLRLERLAQVAQSTGEDWDGVAITLSTGQPGAATQGPLPRPWRVGIQPPRSEALEARPMPAPAAAPMLRAAPAAKAAAADAEEPSFDVSVFQGSFATEFAVPQRVTVPSSGQQVTLALGEQALDTELLVRSTPALDAHAYLIARFATPPGVWPAGALQLYRDGAFVGSGRFDAERSARDGLAFGRDELVSVRSERPEQQQGTGGFIGTRSQRTDARRYSVHNRHTTPIQLQLLDAAPVPEHEDVKVESQYQPAPQTGRWHDEPGTVAWEQPLAAGATQAFSATHVISWPKDQRIQERR